MKQMATACDNASFKYPPHSHTVVFLLDQTRAAAIESLTRWHSFHKKLWSKMEGHAAYGILSGLASHSPVLQDDLAKGLRTILRDRGITTGTLKADDMRTILANHDDFVNKKYISGA